MVFGLPRKLKIRKEKEPDFVGSWALGSIEFNEGLFYMYVNQNQNRSGNIHRIKGVIDDVFGEAQFEGQLAEQEITFRKTYSEKAKKKMGQSVSIKYVGKKINGIYLGEFEMKDNFPFWLGVNNSPAFKEIGKFILYSPKEKELQREKGIYKIPK